MCVFRIDVEWSRGRLFDRDVALLFQRIVTEARALRCVEFSAKEERRQRPNGRALPPADCFNLQNVSGELRSSSQGVSGLRGSATSAYDDSWVRVVMSLAYCAFRECLWSDHGT